MIYKGTRFDGAGLVRVGALWVCRRNVRKGEKETWEYRSRYK